MTSSLTSASKTIAPHDEDLVRDHGARQETKPVAIGHGHSIAHHGELIQGEFDEDDGTTHRALVTVPCELFHSEATFYVDDNIDVVQVEPHHKIKSKRSAQLTLSELVAQGGGRLVIRGNIREGWGLGSSTSECVSSVRSVAGAYKTVLRPEVIAEIVVTAETASDSIMYGNQAILFEQRRGVILEYLPGKLPNLFVLGFNTDDKGVDTLELKLAEYCRDEIDEFNELRGMLRRAVHNQSADLIGVVASASARISQRHLRKSKFDEFKDIAKCVGAVGIQVAHSGTVVGFLFDPKNGKALNQMQQAQALLTETGIEQTWNFELGHERREIKYS
jgi:uncharacterized protein involved in propanediol utilization